MTTKQDLINDINNNVSEYLGFTTSVYGLHSMHKQDLEIYAHNMRRAVLYKNIAKEYRPLTHETLFYSSAGEYTAQYLFWSYLKEVAHHLYFNENENVASEYAYKKVYEE